jgi:hypothetical protein
MSEEAMSCVQSARGPPVSSEPQTPVEGESLPDEGVAMALARVGQNAPDFEATASATKSGRRKSYPRWWTVRFPTPCSPTKRARSARCTASRTRPLA